MLTGDQAVSAETLSQYKIWTAHRSLTKCALRQAWVEVLDVTVEPLRDDIDTLAGKNDESHMGFVVLACAHMDRCGVLRLD